MPAGTLFSEMWLDAVLVVYGILMIGFGTAGTFLSENREPWSLLGGLLIGLMAIVGTVVAKTRPKVGYSIAAVGTLLALGRFAPSFARSQVIYPAGILAGLSLVALLAIAYYFIKRRSRV